MSYRQFTVRALKRPSAGDGRHSVTMTRSGNPGRHVPIVMSCAWD